MTTTTTVLKSRSVLKGDDNPLVNGEIVCQVAAVGQQVRPYSVAHIDTTFLCLYFVAESAYVSESPVRRRTSISSVEDIHPEPDGSTKAAKGTLGKLTNTFNNLRESFSSTHDLDNTVWTARSGRAYDIRLLFKRRIRNLYIAFTNLRSYIEINYSGFRKIVKKYVFNMSFLRF